MYKIIDVKYAKDLKTGEFIPESRTMISSSYVDTPLDFGHCIKRIFSEEKLGLGRVTQEAGLASPELPGFVYHTKLTEIEYVLTDGCLLSYPDGTTHVTQSRDVFLHKPNQPHRLLSASDEHVKLAVSFNGAVPDRVKWEPDAYYSQEGGYTVTYCPDQPNVETGIPGLEFRPIYECPDNHSFAEITLKPGCCIPPEDYQALDDADQILLVTGQGNGTIEFPDRVYKLYNDVAVYIFAGQSYRLHNYTDGDLNIAVWTSAPSFDETGYGIVKLH